MSKPKSDEELAKHNQKAIQTTKAFLDDLASSSDKKDKSRADKLSYWLEDYIKFLKYEKNFIPHKLPKYKRGQVIKVHLGYNIGSEEGGLHYAIVLDKNNSVNSPVVTIVPLTSLKPNVDVSNIRSALGDIFLGNELYRSLDSKFKSLSLHILNEIEQCRSDLKVFDKEETELETLFNEKIAEVANVETIQGFTEVMAEFDKKKQDLQDLNTKIRKRIENLEKEHSSLARTGKEIEKMKIGSIALVNQITTISKIRIYDPKNQYDILSNIRISNEALDKIDKALSSMYTNITSK